MAATVLIVEDQMLIAWHLSELIEGAGRVPYQRTTVYGEASAERVSASFQAAPLQPAVNRPPRRQERPREQALVRFG